MENNLKFKKLFYLLQSSPWIYAQDCYSDLKGEGVYFKIYNKNQLLAQQIEVLERRAENLNPKASILGLAEVVKNLKGYHNGQHVCITTVANKTRTYTIHTDVDFNTLLGVFVKTNRGIEKLLELEQNNLNRGYDNIDRWAPVPDDDFLNEK